MIKIAGRQYDGFECEALLKERVAALDFEHEGETMPQAARDEWNELNAAIDEFAKRRDRLRELANDPRRTEPGFIPAPAVRTEDPSLPPRLREARDMGLRTIERHQERSVQNRWLLHRRRLAGTQITGGPPDTVTKKSANTTRNSLRAAQLGRPSKSQVG